MFIDFGGRFDGPLTFRLILQPLGAAILGLRAGLSDAREGRPPYLWTLLTDSSHRRELLLEGWKAIAKVFVIAVIADMIYQWIVHRWVYPLEAVIVAFFLAVVPYVLVRGPLNRIVRRFGKKKTVPDAK